LLVSFGTKVGGAAPEGDEATVVGDRAALREAVDVGAAVGEARRSRLAGERSRTKMSNWLPLAVPPPKLVAALENTT
jgi:hypothetical protein